MKTAEFIKNSESFFSCAKKVKVYPHSLVIVNFDGTTRHFGIYPDGYTCDNGKSFYYFADSELLHLIVYLAASLYRIRIY